jgi:hypothetical protein
MSATISSEVISRRRALPLLGLAAALSLGLPTGLAVSDAKAQDAGEKKGGEVSEEKSGTERRQARHPTWMERRRARRRLLWERRQERLRRRSERREMRHTVGKEATTR